MHKSWVWAYQQALAARIFDGVACLWLAGRDQIRGWQQHEINEAGCSRAGLAANRAVSAIYFWSMVSTPIPCAPGRWTIPTQSILAHGIRQTANLITSSSARPAAV